MTTVATTQPTLVVITIGQTPRVDLVPELAASLPAVRLVERGLLDGRSAAEIAALAPAAGDEVLVTRLADGTSARLSAAWTERALQQAVAAEVNATAGDTGASHPPAGVLVACSGSFELGQRAAIPVFFPDQILQGYSRFLAQSFGALCIVVPDAAQESEVAARARAALPAHTAIHTAAVDPYTGTAADWDAAAARVAAQGAPFVLLDCIGFTAEHAAQLRQATGATVLTARGTAAAVIAQVLAPEHDPSATRAGETA